MEAEEVELNLEIKEVNIEVEEAKLEIEEKESNKKHRPEFQGKE